MWHRSPNEMRMLNLQETAALLRKEAVTKTEVGSDVHNLCENENSADYRGELLEYFMKNRISWL